MASVTSGGVGGQKIKLGGSVFVDYKKCYIRRCVTYF